MHDKTVTRSSGMNFNNNYVHQDKIVQWFLPPRRIGTNRLTWHGVTSHEGSGHAWLLLSSSCITRLSWDVVGI